MNKAILVSVPPEVCARIANGEQTLLLMKRIPKLDAPYRVYMYETKGQFVKFIKGAHTSYGYGSGKVIGSFVCEKVDEFRCCFACYKRYNNFEYDSFIDNGIYQIDGDDGVVFERPDTRVDSMLKNNDLSRMCMIAQDLYRKIGVGNRSCTLHITDLTIFDKPKELGEFNYPCPKKFAHEYDCACGFKECKYKVTDRVPFECAAEITRPPQSWCYEKE